MNSYLQVCQCLPFWRPLFTTSDAAGCMIVCFLFLVRAASKIHRLSISKPDDVSFLEFEKHLLHMHSYHCMFSFFFFLLVQVFFWCFRSIRAYHGIFRNSVLTKGVLFNSTFHQGPLPFFFRRFLFLLGILWYNLTNPNFGRRWISISNVTVQRVGLLPFLVRVRLRILLFASSTWEWNFFFMIVGSTLVLENWQMIIHWNN